MIKPAPKRKAMQKRRTSYVDSLHQILTGEEGGVLLELLEAIIGRIRRFGDLGDIAI